MLNSIQMPVLIVEDNAERIAKFQSWLPENCRMVVVTSAGKAMGVLQRASETSFACICLDHDLQEQVTVAAERSLSSTDLLNLIANKIDLDVPILIHSMNTPRAISMEKRLVNEGFRVTRIAMADLTQESFLDWLSLGRAFWDEISEE